MAFCRNCAQELGDDWKVCPKCGTSVAATTAARPAAKAAGPWSSMGRSGKIGSIVLGVIFLAIIAGAMLPSDDTTPTANDAVSVAASPAPTIALLGKTVLSNGGGSKIVVATSKAWFDKIIAAESDRRIAEIALQGGAFLVDQGTEAEVIDRAFATRQVVIRSGPMAGREGWVPYEWVKDI